MLVLTSHKLQLKSHIYICSQVSLNLHGQLWQQVQAGTGEPKARPPLAEEVVPKVTLRICGLQFLVQIAPLLSRTELETLTPLLALASVSTPKSIVDRFILKNAVVITNDWLGKGVIIPVLESPAHSISLLEHKTISTPSLTKTQWWMKTCKKDKEA